MVVMPLSSSAGWSPFGSIQLPLITNTRTDQDARFPGSTECAIQERRPAYTMGDLILHTAGKFTSGGLAHLLI